uniref:Uncharacterized protein n=1 Tax=Arundo donax TaxID=35708 RepID=A0A0A9BB73_ARUDO
MLRICERRWLIFCIIANEPSLCLINGKYSHIWNHSHYWRQKLIEALVVLISY